MTKYTYAAHGKTWGLYACAKRGCDTINPDYMAFGSVNGKTYCMHHIPFRSRFRLWRQERSQ